MLTTTTIRRLITPLLHRLPLPPPPPTSPLLRNASSSVKKPPTRSSKLTDEQIPHPIITLVDPTTSSLLPPAPLNDLLISLNRTRFSILLVDPSHDPPICRIQDKKADYAKAQAKKGSKADALLAAQSQGEQGVVKPAQVKNMAGPPREVQLTWGVSGNDLGHKLKKAKELLAKGNRVTVVLSSKKGSGDKLDQKSRESVIKGIRDALEAPEVGAKLRAPVENKGSQVMMEFGRAG